MFTKKPERGWRRVIFRAICYPKDKTIEKEKLVAWVTREADWAKKEGEEIARIRRYTRGFLDGYAEAMRTIIRATKEDSRIKTDKLSLY